MFEGYAVGPENNNPASTIRIFSPFLIRPGLIWGLTRQSIRLCICHYRDEHNRCKISDQ